MPKLSILVPTYNRVHYLKECLDSLLLTTVDCEIIVSDNVSTDNTELVMRGYTDPRVRYVRQKVNGGGIVNYNFLLSEARGEYICLFGDDDRALPHCFEQKVALLDAFPAIDMVYSLAQVIDEEGRVQPSGRVMGHQAHSYLGGRNDFNDLLLNCFISWQTLVLRREVYEAVGPLGSWGLKASDDWYWLQLCVRNRQVAFLCDRTVQIRMHANSYSSSIAEKEGSFLSERLLIWRKWLLEASDPPIVTELMWERMHGIIKHEALSVHGANQAKFEACLAELAELQAAYTLRMQRRFEEQVLPVLHAELQPWPLVGRKRVAFLHHPTWQAQSWIDVLDAYCRAFTAEDDATLVLCLDTAQNVPLELALEGLQSVISASGLPPEACPDVLLVPEALGRLELARLFASVDWIVPQGDALQASRAEQAGKPMLTSLSPEAWRAALE